MTRAMQIQKKIWPVNSWMRVAKLPGDFNLFAFDDGAKYIKKMGKLVSGCTDAGQTVQLTCHGE